MESITLCAKKDSEILILGPACLAKGETTVSSQQILEN